MYMQVKRHTNRTYSTYKLIAIPAFDRKTCISNDVTAYLQGDDDIGRQDQRAFASVDGVLTSDRAEDAEHVDPDERQNEQRLIQMPVPLRTELHVPEPEGSQDDGDQRQRVEDDQREVFDGDRQVHVVGVVDEDEEDDDADDRQDEDEDAGEETAVGARTVDADAVPLGKQSVMKVVGGTRQTGGGPLTVLRLVYVIPDDEHYSWKTKRWMDGRASGNRCQSWGQGGGRDPHILNWGLTKYQYILQCTGIRDEYTFRSDE